MIIVPIREATNSSRRTLSENTPVPEAARARTALVTAFGFDFVPGNLAAELALRQAGPDATRLEVAVSARDGTHWPVLRRDLLDPLLDAHVTPRSERAALEIMECLVENRLHRAVPLPDIMIASIAAVERLTVLHDDRDFERIHEVYGEPVVERLGLVSS